MSHENKPNFGPLSASMEGALASLNLKRIQNYQVPKEYPANYAGLVAAILELNWGQSSTGPRPPTWMQTEQEYAGGTPPEGALWYDTRQGRLLVYAHDGWYQTNGGDGIPVVRANTEPPNPVLGQLWIDSANRYMYYYDGLEFRAVESEIYVSKTTLESVLNASATYADFKTNLLALL